MVTSDCAMEWLERHPYFNNGLGASTEDTTIELATPYISGSDLVLNFTITDADGLHQAQFFHFVEADGGYDDLNLLDCQSLTDSPATATFTTSALTAETDKVAIRVIDGAGRSTEQHFSVDFTALSQNSLDVNADGAVNIQDMVLVANNIGQQGQNRADVNRDSIVNIQDLVLVANAFSTSNVLR